MVIAVIGILASHGFVVVAMDHADAAVTAFPDGTYLAGWEGREAGPTAPTEAWVLDRVRDLTFVLDQLEEWNQGDPVFAGRFDLGRASSMGVSRGAASAADFCRVDTRCQATTLLDGGSSAEACTGSTRSCPYRPDGAGQGRGSLSPALPPKTAKGRRHSRTALWKLRNGPRIGAPCGLWATAAIPTRRQ